MNLWESFMFAFMKFDFGSKYLWQVPPLFAIWRLQKSIQKCGRGKQESHIIHILAREAKICKFLVKKRPAGVIWSIFYCNHSFIEKSQKHTMHRKWVDFLSWNTYLIKYGEANLYLEVLKIKNCLQTFYDQRR